MEGEKRIDGPDIPRGYFAEQYRRSQMANERLMSASALQETVPIQLKREMVHFTNTRWHNFVVLVDRSWNSKVHDRSFFMSRFVKILYLGFIFGTLFSNIGTSQQAVLEIVSLMQFSTMVFGLGAIAYMGGCTSRERVIAQ